ncbi:hypothetical protein AAG906_037409 [Vitis piasezkii]
MEPDSQRVSESSYRSIRSTTGLLVSLLELRTEIQSIKKEGLLVDEYVLKLKTLTNKLGSIGEPVTNKDQLIYLFQGLRVECNSFVTSVKSRLDQPIVEKVHSLQNTSASDKLNLVPTKLSIPTQMAS